MLLPLQTVKAEVISTGKAIDPQALNQLLSDPQIARRLDMLGVDREEARERIQAMTEEERAVLSRDVQSLPAGGNLGYEVVFAATGIIIVAGLVMLVWFLVKKSRDSAEVSAGS